LGHSFAQSDFPILREIFACETFTNQEVITKALSYNYINQCIPKKGYTAAAS